MAKKNKEAFRNLILRLKVEEAKKKKGEVSETSPLVSN